MRLRLTEIDRPLTAVVVALAAYGLATLYSAGQTDVPTFVTTIWQRQLIWLGVGLVAIVLMFRTSPRLLEWATPYAYGIGVVVLLLTLATGTGAGTAASERSWIAIGGVRLGQPAELAKLAVVLMLARWEGEAVLLGHVLMGVVAVPFWGRLAPYQQNRLLAFLNPEVDPRATGWHVIQSKIAIGSGGLLGQGFTHGPQKRLAFLPAQHTDFIFPVVGEELGFVGVLIALVLLMALILILLRIARRATDPYSSLCVFGVAGLLFTHIIENVGMTVNLLPITGIPLPFFSYGGSFLLACSIAVGISLRVAWESRQSGYAEL